MLLHRIKNIFTIHLTLFVLLNIYQATYVKADQQPDKNVGILFQALENLPNQDRFQNLNRNLNKLYQALGISERELSQNNKGNVTAAFEAFTKTMEADDETRNSLEQWDNYLQSATHFSNADYIKAINSQQINYYKAIAELNDRLSSIRQFPKEYSSTWVDDLINHFGEDYVKNNRDAILDNFGAIISRDYLKYGKELKNLIYIEAMLYGSYREYLGMFIDYFNREIDDGARKKLQTRKEAAQAFLDLINEVSFTRMHENYVFKEKMADNMAIEQDKELFLFFKDHALSQFFDMSKACSDLRRVIKVLRKN